MRRDARLPDRPDPYPLRCLIELLYALLLLFLFGATTSTPHVQDNNYPCIDTVPNTAEVSHTLRT